MEALISDIDRDTDRRHHLETLSTSTFLAEENWPAFYAQAKDSLRGRAYLVLTDREGRQLINTYVPYDQAPAVTGDPESLQRIRQTARPVVSDLFTSLVVRQPVYNISIPVRRGNEVRFVMSLGLLPEDLRALLQSQSLPAGWSAHLGQQGRHHGAPARPGAAGGHGGPAVACRAAAGQGGADPQYRRGRGFSRRRPRPVVRLDHRGRLPGSVGRQAAEGLASVLGRHPPVVGGWSSA